MPFMKQNKLELPTNCDLTIVNHNKTYCDKTEREAIGKETNHQIPFLLMKPIMNSTALLVHNYIKNINYIVIASFTKDNICINS